MSVLLARYADTSGEYTIRLDGDVLWTSIDSGVGVETFAYRIVPASETGVDDWTEWMLTPRFGSTPDGGEGHGFVRIDGVEFVLESLETTTETETRSARRARCTGTTAFADLSLPSGWPHGRVECDVCGAFVFRNRDGALRAHVVRDAGSETPYERENRSELWRLRIENAR